MGTSNRKFRHDKTCLNFLVEISDVMRFYDDVKHERHEGAVKGNTITHPNLEVVTCEHDLDDLKDYMISAI